MPRVNHTVLFKFKDEITKEQIDSLFAQLASLKKESKVAGLLSFSWGPYDSSEGRNGGFQYGFTMIFESTKARDDYLPHPEHIAVVNVILPMLKDEPNSVIAFDYNLNGDNEF